MSVKKIAIFASGSGSNAEQITNYFHKNASSDTVIDLILSNKADAFVLERAEKLNIDSKVFNKKEFYHSDGIINLLVERKIDLIVLAGFLWLVPQSLIQAFPNRIINIHPALLPKYGGKGMYGSYVHDAVIANQEKESGITIHLVDEVYDNGKILRQEKCTLTQQDTAESLAQKIHILEYDYFPVSIEEYLNDIPASAK